MAGVALITVRHLASERRRDGLHPGSGAGRLAAVHPRGVEGKPDDELADIVLGDDGRQRLDIGTRARPAADRGERTGPAVGVGDGETDPPFPEVDAEDPTHGAELGVATPAEGPGLAEAADTDAGAALDEDPPPAALGAAVSTGTGSLIVRSTRAL